MIFLILPDEEEDSDKKGTAFREQNREPQSSFSHDQRKNENEDDMEEEGSHKGEKSGDESIIEIREEGRGKDVESR